MRRGSGSSWVAALAVWCVGGFFNLAQASYCTNQNFDKMGAYTEKAIDELQQRLEEFSTLTQKAAHTPLLHHRYPVTAVAEQLCLEEQQGVDEIRALIGKNKAFVKGFRGLIEPAKYLRHRLKTASEGWGRIYKSCWVEDQEYKAANKALNNQEVSDRQLKKHAQPFAQQLAEADEIIWREYQFLKAARGQAHALCGWASD